MQEFHTFGKLPRGSDTSFIALIPKREAPIGLGDYRSISLIDSLYKIIVKVLSLRLKLVTPYFFKRILFKN